MLREVRDDDLPVFFAHQADPAAWDLAKVPTRDRETFDAHWERIRRDPTMILRTIEADGAVVGNIGSFLHDGRRVVGYWIGREHWGRGFATTALREFLDVVTERPLAATVARDNHGSMRVLEKCGFARTGEHEDPDGVRIVEFVLDA